MLNLVIFLGVVNGVVMTDVTELAVTELENCKLHIINLLLGSAKEPFFFNITVPEDVDLLHFSLKGSSHAPTLGNPALYVSIGRPENPKTIQSYRWSSAMAGPYEMITLDRPHPGDYFGYVTSYTTGNQVRACYMTHVRTSESPHQTSTSELAAPSTAEIQADSATNSGVIVLSVITNILVLLLIGLVIVIILLMRRIYASKALNSQPTSQRLNNKCEVNTHSGINRDEDCYEIPISSVT